MSSDRKRSSQVPVNSLIIPKINTIQMDDILKEVIGSFSMTVQTASLWICGRAASFGFRPSMPLSKIMTDWIDKLKAGFVVITPIVFYTCASDNIENIEDNRRGSKGGRDFLVYNHYNILISYLTAKGSINIERYEPADSLVQGNLNFQLKSLFEAQFKKYTDTPISFALVAPKGLQANYKDRRLCGHHILYWTIYRLKYGLQAAISVLSDPSVNQRFERFCNCMSGNRGSKDDSKCADSI
jgi:hypothetical protein